MHDGPSRVLWLRLVRLIAASSGRGAVVHVSELLHLKLSDPARIQSRPHQRVACGPHAPRRRQYSRRARARGPPGAAVPRRLARRGLAQPARCGTGSNARNKRAYISSRPGTTSVRTDARVHNVYGVSRARLCTAHSRVYLDAHQRHVLCSALSAGAHGRAHHAQTRRPMRRPERQLAAEETGPHHPTVPRTRRHLDQRLIMF